MCEQEPLGDAMCKQFCAVGGTFKADVAVADGMQLPYASQRFDAVLCIAVLHHITSPQRRIEMLTELLRVLRPGGKALVTAWATEQEDMKKLSKWQPIPQPGRQTEYSASTGAGYTSSNVVANDAAAKCHSELEDDSRKQHAGSDGHMQDKQTSNDYFVPWHLPFHRAEAAVQVLKAGPAGTESPASSIRVDNKKGAVVFSRYYHVFEQFELDRLVQQVPQAEVLESFYDKDNWCVVMRRSK